MGGDFDSSRKLVPSNKRDGRRQKTLEVAVGRCEEEKIKEVLHKVGKG